MYELRVVWEKDGEKIYRFSTAAEARAFQYGITEEVAKNKNRILPQIIISKKAKSELNSNKREGFIAGLTSLLTALFTCVWWYVLTRSEILVEAKAAKKRKAH